MEVREGYKQTEIGVIPHEWYIQRLHSLVRYHNAGIYKKKELYGKGCNIVGVSNLYEIHYVGGQEFGRVALSEQELKQYSLTNNDLLYGESSLVREGIARTVYVTKGGAGTAFAWHTRRYSVDQKALLSKYLYYYLQSRPARKHMMDKCIQTALTGINTSEYFACPIPIPPLTEQTAIATALSDADALIQSLEKLIAKKRNIKQGAIQELLKPKEGWVVKKLGDVAVLKARIGWQGLTTAEYKKTGDYYLITGTDFKKGFIDWENCCYVDYQRYKQDRNIQVKENDVLVTKDGTIGKVAFIKNVPKPATLNSGVFVIRPIKQSFYSEFFYYILLSEHFGKFLTQLSAGSTINHLYQKDFVYFEFQAPKTIEEQTRIATILSDMDAGIAALETKLAKYKQVKQGMMQELLTGRTRLV